MDIKEYSCNTREEVLIEKIEHRIKDTLKACENDTQVELKVPLKLLCRHTNKEYRIRVVLEEI